MNLSEAIGREAEKLIRRHQRYASQLEDDTRRIERRSGTRPPKTVAFPSYWSTDPGFDPYYVRSRSKSIGYAVNQALRVKAYTPRPAVLFDVPKSDGTLRGVSVFQIADNAISRTVFKQLLAKNSTRLSSRSYAYRSDLTLHDAVLDMSADVRHRKRLFIAEFDFRKYFDRISHAHIERLLTSGRYFITPTELSVIRAFLVTPSLPQATYSPSAGERRTIGIPQGTSLSLFLANIAAAPLDRRLERLGVGFARFADDTVIWSDDYSLVCRAANALEEAEKEMGVELNLQKSDGISMLVPAEGIDTAELKAKSAIEFVGYRVSLASIGIRDRAVARIKERIAFLIYSNLLQEPKRGTFVAARIAPPIDRDYVVAIGQIRRYLYGDLTESTLRRYLAREKPRLHYKGLMSFYPIVDDEVLLKRLDGWLLHTLHTTLRTRARLFKGPSATSMPQPHGLTPKALLSFVGTTTQGKKLDLRVPSFLRISKLLRNAASAHGANAVANSQTLYGATPNRSAGYWPLI